MIAPIREADQPTTTPGMRRARRMVASTFLKRQEGSEKTSWVPRWQAWVFTGWILIVSIAYFSSMLGWP